MNKTNIKFKIPVSFLKEGKQFIAYSPVLDLSTSGKTFGEARSRFIEIVNIFFEEIIEKGTLNEVLTDLGWKRIKKEWTSPILISEESQTVSVSV